MDNILDKFGLYDFFALLLPGMVFVLLLDIMDFPLIILGRYQETQVFRVVAFILFSYILGILMQEIGSFVDERWLHMRENAMACYLNQSSSKNKILSFFTNTKSFGDEEKKNIKELVNSIICDNIEEKQKSRASFFHCKSYLENNDKIGKADRLNTMFAMS